MLNCLKPQNRVVGWGLRLRPLGPKGIDGLPVPPGKAYTLLTDHMIIGVTAQV